MTATSYAFVALRPNGAADDPEHVLENVLFGSGRHVYLVPPGHQRKLAFERVLLAWNGSREAARALAESLPYPKIAVAVTMCVVDARAEAQARIGADAEHHLSHHRISAALHHVDKRNGDVAEALIAEVGRQRADLIVTGGYGHSRLREWLLGGVTYELLHQASAAALARPLEKRLR